MARSVAQPWTSFVPSAKNWRDAALWQARAAAKALVQSRTCPKPEAHAPTQWLIEANVMFAASSPPANASAPSEPYATNTHHTEEV